MAKKDYFQELKKIILKEKWLMDIFCSVRKLNLPDWYLSAGVIRNTVWDVLHEYKERTPLNDIDLVYYDPKKNINEREIEQKLQMLYPKHTFEVVNQAFVHKIYRYKKKAKSSCEGIAQFIEIPTCVGVRLEKDDSLTICAPHGLKDLFTLHVYPICQHGEPFSHYTKRMQEKKWKKTWPKLIISSF